MGHYVEWGLALIWLVSLVMAVALVAGFHRRSVRLERRAAQAERLAELGTLTSGLAHEIKNPLSTLQLNLQLLQEDLDPANPSSSRIVNRLNTVHREASRLKDILDDFLRYAGKIELDRRPVELNELTAELADFLSPQAQLQRVQLRLDRGPAPAPVTVLADSRLLKQALLNLLLNALQALGDRGGEVILRVSRAPREARIDVIDTGPGIAPDALDEVFRAYYSTKKGGTGLGLAMTRRIVEEHGGRITVTSEPGKGADFSIHLPVHPA